MDAAENSHQNTGTPPSRDAYTNAPDLHREIHQVLALDAERDGRQPQPATRPPTDATGDTAAAERARLLRRAALMDRIALDDPRPGPLAAAAETAEQLLLHDHRHPDQAAGPHHPDTTTPTPTHRSYVRQEYAAWTAAGRPGT
ncbi:hypothetical protein ACIP9H_38450 [Streptomyces sp. NPDC088732]|uniref:hypothetical protein n=1 Tax=Streptomyces sp. NPDC088732 TaxID=3365879 RepID=UPI0038008D82